jgi:hypothetical protein
MILQSSSVIQLQVQKEMGISTKEARCALTDTGN